MSKPANSTAENQESIAKVFSQLGLATPEARAYFTAMAPARPQLPMRVVISSTSNPF